MSETATMTVAQELFAAAATIAVIPQTGRKRDDVLRDLTKAIEAVSDETWAKLSPEAHKWYNDSVGKVNGLQPPPKLPGYDDLASGAERPTTGGSEVSAEVLVGEKEEKPAASESPKVSVEISIPSEPPAVYLSASELCRQIVIEHLDWSEAQVKEALIQIAPSHAIPVSKITDNLVWTYRTYTTQAMKTAQRLGWRPPDK